MKLSIMMCIMVVLSIKELNAVASSRSSLRSGSPEAFIISDHKDLIVQSKKH